MRLTRLLSLAAVCCAACDTTSTPAASVTLCDADLRTVMVSPSTVILAVGDSAALSASYPKPACDVPPLPVPFKVLWRSSNPAVVTVDSSTGRIRGVGSGQTTVLAIVTDAEAFKGAAAVQVNPR